MNIGSAPQKWTAQYLASHACSDKPVAVHVTQEPTGAMVGAGYSGCSAALPACIHAGAVSNLHLTAFTWQVW